MKSLKSKHSIFIMLRFLFLTISIFFVCSIKVQAQDIIYTCSNMNFCLYNSTEKTAQDCIPIEKTTAMVLNESGTQMIHFSEDLVSLYQVLNTEYNATHHLLYLEVLSDAGNQYLFVIDENHWKITVYFYDDDYIFRVVYFTIEQIEG